VIPSLVSKVMKGDDPIVVWGSGEQRRNFLHARDFAWGMMLLTERHATAEPVNLGFEDTVSMKDLVSAILRACRREGCRVEFDPTKPEGRVVKSADATKLRAIAPEFRSRVSLDQGMTEVVEWYRRSFGARVSGAHAPRL
jgi:nucleoside-diphosphate-sugar epimerase